MWAEVLDRCNKKLARWKSLYISLWGRLTLIKSVLDALPSYMMSLFPIPKNTVKKINQLRRSFLWNWNKQYKCYFLVKWDTLTLSRKQGGLGIKKLNLQNNCRLQKWLWRFCIDDQSLWKRVITMKYGKLDYWGGSWNFWMQLWKTIRRLWPQFKGNISL